MRGKIIVLILVFVFLIISGCSEKENQPALVNKTTAPQDGIAEQKDNAITGQGEIHTVFLRYPVKVMVPSELEIKTGDTVSWWSDKPQKPDYILVSKEGLFPDKELDYRVPYNYTFSSPGSYLFSVKDIPEMNVTVTVK